MYKTKNIRIVYIKYSKIKTPYHSFRQGECILDYHWNTILSVYPSSFVTSNSVGSPL